MVHIVFFVKTGELLFLIDEVSELELPWLFVLYDVFCYSCSHVAER